MMMYPVGFRGFSQLSRREPTNNNQKAEEDGGERRGRWRMDGGMDGDRDLWDR